MNENLRQAYLRTMGIDVFYPRAPVPGARPSPQYDLSVPAFLEQDSQPRQTGKNDRAQIVEESAGRPEAEQRRPASGVTATSARSARAALMGLEQPASSRQPPSTPAGGGVKNGSENLERVSGSAESASADTGTGAGTDAAPKFRLEYRRISQRIAVLLEVPLHAQPQMSSQTDQLLANILRALEVDLVAREELRSGKELFNWPLLDDLPVEESTLQKAGQALLGFIAMRRQRDDFENLLVFTSQSGQVAGLLPDAAGASGNDYRTDRLGCFLTRVSSLQEILSVPGIKREVWQDLQPLRKRLQTA